jgi:hypothetical protein
MHGRKNGNTISSFLGAEQSPMSLPFNDNISGRDTGQPYISSVDQVFNANMGCKN